MDINQSNNHPRKMWCYLCKWEFETLQNPTEQSKCSKCNNDFCEEITSSYDPRTFVPFGEDNIIEQPVQQQQFQQPQQPQLPIQSQNPLSIPLGPQLLPLSSLSQNNPQSQTSSWSGTTQVNNGTMPLSYSISIQTMNGNNRSGQNNGGSLNFNSLLSSLFPNTAQRHRTSRMNEQTRLDNILDFLLRNDTNVHGTPPAAETSINQLSRIKYSTPDDGNLNECTVCKDDLVVDEEVIKMPCNHLFHPDCLLTWLKMHNSCPTCRYELPTNNEDYERRKIQIQNQQNSQNNNNNRRM